MPLRVESYLLLVLYSFGPNEEAKMSGISKIIRTIKEKRAANILGKEDICFRGQRSKDTLVPSLLRKPFPMPLSVNEYADVDAA